MIPEEKQDPLDKLMRWGMLDQINAHEVAVFQTLPMNHENRSERVRYEIAVTIPILVSGKSYQFACAIPFNILPNFNSSLATKAEVLSKLELATKFLIHFRNAVLLEPFASAVQTFCNYQVNHYLNVDYPSKFLYNTVSRQEDFALKFLWNQDPTQKYCARNWDRIRNDGAAWRLQDEMMDRSATVVQRYDPKAAETLHQDSTDRSLISDEEDQSLRRTTQSIPFEFPDDDAPTYSRVSTCSQDGSLRRRSIPFECPSEHALTTSLSDDAFQEKQEELAKLSSRLSGNSLVSAKMVAQIKTAYGQSIVKRWLSLKPGVMVRLQNFATAEWLINMRVRIIEHESIRFRHIKEDIDGRKLRFKIEYCDEDLKRQRTNRKLPRTVSVLNVTKQ